MPVQFPRHPQPAAGRFTGTAPWLRQRLTRQPAVRRSVSRPSARAAVVLCTAALVVGAWVGERFAEARDGALNPRTPLTLLLPLGGAQAATAGAESGPRGAVLSGERRLLLHPREGDPVTIGTVRFTPADGGAVKFDLHLDHARFTDHFLSMKEFKCLEVPREVFCHVPYPYSQPGTVRADDLAWLEHALLFLFKQPREFGAKLWNGVYWQLKTEGGRLVGQPQAVDLNRISAPPDDPSRPPFRPALRDDMPDDARWFHRLTIE